MSWLSKIGGILKGVSAELPYVGPVLAAFIPGTKDDQIIQKVTAGVSGVTDAFGDLTSIVTLYEAGGQSLGLTGAQKLQMASGPAAKILLSSAAFSGKKIKDPALFQKGAGEIAGGIADCWNAVDESDVEAQKA